MNVTKLPSGQWRVSVKYKGQRRTATARTQSLAQQLGATMIIEMGGAPKQTELTVADLLSNWLAVSDFSATYRSDAERIARVMPKAFAQRTLSSVSPLVIDHFYRQLAEAGFSPHRVRRFHEVLSSAWSMALRYEWANHNPFSWAKKPTVPKRRATAPHVDDVVRVLAAADETFALYLQLSATAGGRRGEMVGLQWNAVGETTLDMHRALAYTPETGVIVKEVKPGPKGNRVVSMPVPLMRRLRAHRKAQLEMAVANGLPAPLWVFSDDAGVTPWRPDFVTYRWIKLRDSLGLKGVRLHDMRHFMASQALAAGVPLSVVSDRLGHTNRQTTSDLYGHMVPAADRQVSDIMGRLLG